ncbi:MULTISPECIES: DUF1330 domain-containing protein [Marinovum]|jgi:uncharacterized protein (DUF1330 family)|uniref:DUF1330 domain-containing protein n=1 Tax=Marinovum TaxID=367771 RepID=UPI00065B23AE|nr:MULTISPECIES: DUF1330 domain-containing protein [Marinovum]AKO95568.1 hypothetical protein MALG_00363 [Marinovum algicola DG 898]MDD9741493.1 DUF1330 domain-containing protein [Marinovum sp. SP66]
MPKGYLIAHIRVQDKAAFEEFKALSGPAIEAHGGKVLVRNPAPDHREGAAEGLAVVIEFESLAAAQAFYDSEAYGAARAVRETCAETDLVLAEGL